MPQMPSIINHWPVWFRDKYGTEWPRAYCCLDVESSGFSLTEDVLTQWGHCLVEDGKVVDRLSLTIDWTDHPVVNEQWLRRRLNNVRQNMELSGKRYKVSIERMEEEGVKPAEALAFIRDFTDTLKANGTIFVAHGGVFDEKMLAANFVGFGIAPDFSFGDDGLLDTELIEKASQLIGDKKAHPQPGDTLRSYFHRVKYIRKAGVKSNLDEWCFEKYKLTERHGVAKADLHDAYTDAYCVHLLMEEFRQLITEKPAAPMFPVPPEQTLLPFPPEAAPAPRAVVVAGGRVRGQRRN